MKEKPTCVCSKCLGVRRMMDTSHTIMCLEKCIHVKALLKNEKPTYVFTHSSSDYKKGLSNASCFKTSSCLLKTITIVENCFII